MPRIRQQWLQSASALNIDAFEAWTQDTTQLNTTVILNLHTHDLFADTSSPAPDLTADANFFSPPPAPAPQIRQEPTDPTKVSLLRRMWDEKLQQVFQKKRRRGCTTTTATQAPTQ